MEFLFLFGLLYVCIVVRSLGTYLMEWMKL